MASSWRVRLGLLVLCAPLLPIAPAPAQASAALPGKIVGWGSNLQGQTSPPAGNNFIAIDAGAFFSLALRSNGTIAAWGANDDGQLNVPPGNDFIAIAAGTHYGLALHADGSIAAWGAWRHSNGPPDEVPAGPGYTAIAAEADHLALRSDGSIAWGSFATPPPGTGYTAIAVGQHHYLALRTDGSIVGWRADTSGISPPPPDYGEANPPAGTGYTAISAGHTHSLALRADGSIVGWGNNSSGQASPPAGNDFIAIDAGGFGTSLALRSDGSIVGWGDDEPFNQAQPPPGTGYTAVAVGGAHGLALQSKPPQTKITKGAPNKTEKTSMKFKFRSNKAGSKFECKLDKKAWRPCASPTKVKGLNQGKHVFQVRAINTAGAVDPSSAKDKFKVVR